MIITVCRVALTIISLFMISMGMLKLMSYDQLIVVILAWGLSESLSNVIAILSIMAEIIIGLGVLYAVYIKVELRVRVMAAVIMFFLLSAILHLWILLGNVNIDCGCLVGTGITLGNIPLLLMSISIIYICVLYVYIIKKQDI